MGIAASFAGNLTGKPDSRPAGSNVVTSFTVAVDDGYRDKSGEWHKRPTLYVNVEAWGGAARAAARFRKGQPVVVIGSWRVNEYEVDGEKRRRHIVVADRLGPGASEAAPKDTEEEPATQEPDDEFWSGAK